MRWPVPDRFDDAAPMLLPALRTPTAPPNAWLTALDDEAAALARQPFAPFVDRLLTLDLPEVRLFVQRAHLDRWGVGLDAAWAAAIANLPETATVAPLDGTPGAWAVGGDGVDSARLARPGWLEGLRGIVTGAPIAFIPDARTLWIVGADDDQALQATLTRAWDRWNEAGTPISPVPCSGGPLPSPWRPPTDHPLVHRVGVAARFLAGSAYRAQQQPLAAWLLERGDPTWVSPYTLIRHRTGRVVSFAHWPDGPTLLPEVDLVALGPPGDGALDGQTTLPLTALRALGVVGPPEPGLAPPRMRVERHPDLSRLQGLAVDPRAHVPDI
jgi:hypothetical protein